MIRVGLIGEGAIADTHMQSLSRLPNVQVDILVYGDATAGRAFAKKWNIATATPDLRALLDRAALDAVIIASPSACHAEQATLALQAGKHVLLEIPIGLDLPECEALAALSLTRPNQIAMACHTRRFSPAHRHLQSAITEGTLTLQHLVAQTLFFRRTNLNMYGNARSWVDSLLWHHATHTLDLFVWLTKDPAPQVFGIAGPLHPELGIPMDLSIGVKANNGALLTLALSFNNQGPFGGFYRYIADNGTFHVFRDALSNHQDRPIALTGTAFGDQDRAFFSAISGETAPLSTIADILPSMRLVDRISKIIQT